MILITFGNSLLVPVFKPWYFIKEIIVHYFTKTNLIMTDASSHNCVWMGRKKHSMVCLCLYALGTWGPARH